MNVSENSTKHKVLGPFFGVDGPHLILLLFLLGPYSVPISPIDVLQSFSHSANAQMPSAVLRDSGHSLN